MAPLSVFNRSMQDIKIIQISSNVVIENSLICINPRANLFQWEFGNGLIVPFFILLDDWWWEEFALVHPFVHKVLYSGS